MHRAVDLDGEPDARREEVDDEAPEDDLPTEGHTEPPMAEVLPEDSLGSRR